MAAPVYTFDVGESHSDYWINAPHDAVYDPGETVILVIQEGDGYIPGATYSAELTIYDDAEHVFTVGTTQGVIWYDVAFGEVDPDAATDTAALRNFTLVFNGQTFTEANADFSAQPPVAVLEYGVLKHIKFTAAFPSPVAGYDAVSADNGQVRGLNAGPPLDPPSELPKTAPALMVLDFSGITFDADIPYECAISAGYGTTASNWNHFTVPQRGTANATPQYVRDAALAALRERGVDVKADPDSNTRLVIKAPEGKQLSQVTILVPMNPLPTGPKIHYRDQGSAAALPTLDYRFQE